VLFLAAAWSQGRIVVGRPPCWLEGSILCAGGWVLLIWSCHITQTGCAEPIITYGAFLIKSWGQFEVFLLYGCVD
jgi:hypothetical protein